MLYMHVYIYVCSCIHLIIETMHVYVQVMPKPKQNTALLFKLPQQNLPFTVPMVPTTNTTTYQAICTGHPSDTGVVMGWHVATLGSVQPQGAV